MSAVVLPFSSDKPWQKRSGVDAALESWRERGVFSQVSLERVLPAKEPSFAAMPDRLAPSIVSALKKHGVSQLYTHQGLAIEHALAGDNVVMATPTASGKSVCFHAPVAQRFFEDKNATALYLFPTKALSRDQEASVASLLRDAEIAQGVITFDGDTPGDARRVAKERSGVLITNPDMLHAGILPQHTSWARFFANLKLIVVDELHAYRGVFGSHLANVLRRLLRVATFHGSQPRFVCASATIGNPGEHARRLTGQAHVVISKSGAPRGERHTLVYNPPLVNPELGLRESYLKAAVKLTLDLIQQHVSTLVFAQSRNAVEVMLKYLRDRAPRELNAASSVHAYRGGYLPKERRAIEARMRAGEIKCVVATNALELGIDVGALDAVVCAGYPGSIAATWQRFGRAGRRSHKSLHVLVTNSQPLDQFMASQPERLFDQQAEHARVDANNVEILLQHLKCSAFELPFVLAEGQAHSDGFGDLQPGDVRGALDMLADEKVLFKADSARGAHYRWITDKYPANGISLRSIGYDNFVIIDLDRDKTFAELDWRGAHKALHEQAIYQHGAKQYQVEKLDYENHKAFVRPVRPDYYTTAIMHTKLTVVDEEADAPGPQRSMFGQGEVSVVDKVVGYKKIKYHTHENCGFGDVDLPEMQMHSSGFWWQLAHADVEFLLARLAIDRVRLVEALRGVLNTMHTVSVAALMVDPRDLGKNLQAQEVSVDTDLIEDGVGSQVFEPTMYLFDRLPGGIGLAPRIFGERERLLNDVRQLLGTCGCNVGCPACVGVGAIHSETVTGSMEAGSIEAGSMEAGSMEALKRTNETRGATDVNQAESIKSLSHAVLSLLTEGQRWLH